MYYSLRGTLIAADGRFAAVECGGVGYLCTVSSQTYSQLPELGEEVLLYTHLSVRRMPWSSMASPPRPRRSCFRMLTQVSGVGAKVAIAILSSLTADQVAFAIMAGDSKALTAAPGVGPKLAQRIVLDSRTNSARVRRSFRRVPWSPPCRRHWARAAAARQWLRWQPWDTARPRRQLRWQTAPTP